jgi:replicative DNA helicase
VRKHDITLRPRAGVDDDPPNDENGAQLHYAFRLGGDFILDTPADPSPIWGEGEEVLLADGEALIIAGPQGLGKTTLAQQLLLGRAGFTEY